MSEEIDSVNNGFVSSSEESSTAAPHAEQEQRQGVPASESTLSNGTTKLNHECDCEDEDDSSVTSFGSSSESEGFELEDASDVDSLAELMKDSLELVRNSQFFRLLVQQMEDLRIIDRICKDTWRVPELASPVLLQEPQESSRSHDNQSGHRRIDQTLIMNQRNHQPAGDHSNQIRRNQSNQAAATDASNQTLKNQSYQPATDISNQILMIGQSDWPGTRRTPATRDSTTCNGGSDANLQKNIKWRKPTKGLRKHSFNKIWLLGSRFRLAVHNPNRIIWLVKIKQGKRKMITLRLQHPVGIPLSLSRKRTAASNHETMERTGTTERRIDLVCYGMDRIACWKTYRAHFALAILIKEHFQPEINQAIVYSPHLLRPFETEVMARYGFCVLLCEDESECRRRITVPTLFFMPDNRMLKYERLLRINYTPKNLMRMAILGDSLARYADVARYIDESDVSHLLQLHRSNILDEYAIVEAGFPIQHCFSFLSWYFFYRRCSCCLHYINAN